MKPLLSFLALLLFAHFHVSAQQVTATALDTTQRPSVDTLPMSDIDIPVKINLKALYRMAESKVDTIFHSPGWPGDYYQAACDTRYMYRLRRGRLRINAQGNNMDLKFTGYYQIKASTRLCTGTVGYSPWTPPCSCGSGSEGARRVDMGFSMHFALQPNYTVKSKIIRQPSAALDQCNMCFWGQNVTSQVISAINAQMDTAGWALQSALDKLDLRPQFQQIWNKLWATYHLYNAGYFQLQPVRLRISELYAHNDTLYLSVGVSGRPLISLRPLRDTIVPVPDLSDFTPRHGFHVYLDARLDYDSLASIMNAQVDHHTFTVDNKNITIEKCSIAHLDKGLLQIGLQFSGYQSGTFYLSGLPVLDTTTGLLEISDLDYHLQTNNLLIKTASWLFNKKILKELKDYTRFPLTQYLDQIRKQASAQLNQPFMKGIRSEGQLDKISILQLSAGPSEMMVRCQASGELAVFVNDLTW